MPRLRARGGTSTPGLRIGVHRAANDDAAGCRVLQPGDAAQRRCLAAAGRTEQHDDLAGGDGEGDVVDRGFRQRRSLGGREDLSQVLDAQFGRHYCRYPYVLFQSSSQASCSAWNGPNAGVQSLSIFGIENRYRDRRVAQGGQVALVADGRDLAVIRQGPVHP